MKEEKNGASKNKWSRIFRKKWFFPAVYLTIAAVLLTAVVWYQNMDNQIPDAKDDQETTDDYTPDPYDEDAQSVMEQQEIIKMPVQDQDQAEIVTKFYDSNAEQEDKESALVFYNNRFYQSTGIDIASADGETFDVVASLSGTVAEVKEDPTLGQVVSLSHANDVMTNYASMGDIDVEVGDTVKQGDKLGTAGNNLFGKDHGTHVYFELRKDGETLNPEAFFNQPLSELDKLGSENAEDDVTEDADKPSDSGKEEDADQSGDTEKDPKADPDKDQPRDTGDQDENDDDQVDEENGSQDENEEDPMTDDETSE